MNHRVEEFHSVRHMEAAALHALQDMDPCIISHRRVAESLTLERQRRSCGSPLRVLFLSALEELP